MKKYSTSDTKPLAISLLEMSFTFGASTPYYAIASTITSLNRSSMTVIVELAVATSLVWRLLKRFYVLAIFGLPFFLIASRRLNTATAVNS